MFKRLLPKETSFFDHFERHIALTMQACQEMLALTSDGSTLATRAENIANLERQADEVTHQCIEALHRTFITPIDREYIHRLVKRLDDIIDSVYDAASHIQLYEVHSIRPEAREMVEILVHATKEIQEALVRMRDLRNAEAINDKCIEIYQFENDADQIMRKALARLFKEESDRPIEVIKWKEIFEHLEKACDRCEDVANVIQTIVIEAS
ncbi:TPA: DUF47 domain-containing protein [Candidatus Sumerlaeota bacterium]|jgi:uncharacterized protein|nr:DUF47 domain-containing protein [Candidatus Sumerlaeota bacterium]